MAARRFWVGVMACAIALGACKDDGDGDAAGGSGGAGTSAAGSGGAGTGGGSAGSDGDSGVSGSGGDAGTAFALSSTAVEEGGMLPAKHRCMSLGGPTGPSPALRWSGAPMGTQSFAILFRDRTYMDYEHWTIYDIPASVISLSEGVPAGAEPATPAGAKQAENAAFLVGPGYYGPCGSQGTNTYELTLYALDIATLPDPGDTGDSVQARLEEHDLATTTLTVLSEPP